MINLLPLKNKIEIKKEYLRRLFVSLGFSLFFLALGAVIILLPLFYSLSEQNANYEKQITFSKRSSAFSDSSKIIFEAEKLNSMTASFLHGQKRIISMNEILSKIIKNKNSGVILSGFLYDGGAGSGDGDKISVSGFSRTRKELLEFISALRAEKLFAGVELPPVNLLRENNIKFNVVINLYGDETKK